MPEKMFLNIKGQPKKWLKNWKMEKRKTHICLYTLEIVHCNEFEYFYNEKYVYENVITRIVLNIAVTRSDKRNITVTRNYFFYHK